MLHGTKWKWIPYFAVPYRTVHSPPQGHSAAFGLVGGDGKFGHHLGLWAGWEQKQRYLNGHGDGRTSTEAGRKTVGPWAENKQKADNNLRGHLVPIAIPLLGQTGHMRGG